MKPIVTRLYAVLVALTLVGLAVWAVADWYQLQQKALDQGRSDLRQAAGMVSTMTLHETALEAAGLSRVFAQVPGYDPRWKMLLLSSPERGTEFYRGPRPAVPIDQAVPRWEARSLSEVKMILPVFRTGGEPLALEGIYQFYGRTEIFQLLKAVGVTLLILLVLTTLVVFLSSRAEDPEETAPPVYEASHDIAPQPAPVASSVAAEEDDYWFDDSLTMEELPPLTEHKSAVPEIDKAPEFAAAPPPAPAPVVPPETRPAPAPVAPAASSAPSLFAPESGLGWETFLTTRLDFELNRASGQNQDLALILFTVKNGSAAPETWGRAVREAFPSVDLDFEHDGGAAVVLPGRTLEQALQAARAFLETTDRTLGAVVHAGVAARAGRLLSSSTLLAEATSAKKRSLSGTVRVLGLKTDPDRYREHLSSASA